MPSAIRPSRRRAGTLLVLVVVALGFAATACGSSGSRGASVTLPTRSTTTTAATTSTAAAPTTAVRSTTTTGSTTTSSSSTTSTSTDPTSSTTTSEATTTSSSTTTSEATTTTTRPTTTTTRATTTTTSPTTTSTAAPATSAVPSTVPASEKKVPWLAIGLVAALLALLGLAALRHRQGQVQWWARLDALLRDGQALVDLGRSGPDAADPTQQVAHWSALEQRAMALGSATAAVRADAPDDDTRAALDGLGQSSDQYLASIRSARALRIGPPAPTAEQVTFADAEAGQRLAVVAGHLNQLNQLAVPHRKGAPAGATPTPPA